MKLTIGFFAARVDRHESTSTIVVFDGYEYPLNHTDVRIKAHLLSIPPGTMLEAQLVLDTNALLPESQDSEEMEEEDVVEITAIGMSPGERIFLPVHPRKGVKK